MPALETIRTTVRRKHIPALFLGVTLAAGLSAGCSAQEGDLNPGATADTTATAPPATTLPTVTARPTPQPRQSPDSGDKDTSSPAQFCNPLSEKPVKRTKEFAYYCEVAQATDGVRVVEDYIDASGDKGVIALGATVLVECLAEGPAKASPKAATNPDKPGVAEWYRIVKPVRGYTPSNAYLNVLDPDIPFSDQPTADERVELCEK